MLVLGLFECVFLARLADASGAPARLPPPALGRRSSMRSAPRQAVLGAQPSAVASLSRSAATNAVSSPAGTALLGITYALLAGV